MCTGYITVYITVIWAGIGFIYIYTQHAVKTGCYRPRFTTKFTHTTTATQSSCESAPGTDRPRNELCQLAHWLARGHTIKISAGGVE